MCQEKISLSEGLFHILVSSSESLPAFALVSAISFNQHILAHLCLLAPPLPVPIAKAEVRFECPNSILMLHSCAVWFDDVDERRWVLIPRCDIDGVGEEQ